MHIKIDLAVCENTDALLVMHATSSASILWMEIKMVLNQENFHQHHLKRVMADSAIFL